jgi:hypothetical protein
MRQVALAFAARKLPSGKTVAMLALFAKSQEPIRFRRRRGRLGPHIVGSPPGQLDMLLRKVASDNGPDGRDCSGSACESAAVGVLAALPVENARGVTVTTSARPGPRKSWRTTPISLSGNGTIHRPAKVAMPIAFSRYGPRTAPARCARRRFDEDEKSRIVIPNSLGVTTAENDSLLRPKSPNTPD